jgi:hypothetical protein
MNKRKVILSAILAVPLFLSVVANVYAAPPTPPAAPAPAAADMYSNPITYAGSFGVVDTVPKFLLALVDLVFLIAVPIIVICIIYAGFVFVTAGDNESKIGKARTIFTWTIIGAGVLLGAKAIELAIQSTICALDSSYSSYFCP